MASLFKTGKTLHLDPLQASLIFVMAEMVLRAGGTKDEAILAWSNIYDQLGMDQKPVTIKE